MIRIIVPIPPGVNNLFATVGKRRVKSKRYRDWREAAWASVMQQTRPEAIRGPFVASFLVTRPDKRKRDLDGLLKAPLDLLVDLGLIDDDSLAENLSIGWLGHEKPATMQIIVREA